MSDRDFWNSASLTAYRDEVLRWNRQINLISRQDSAARLEALLDQSAQGLEAVWFELIADRLDGYQPPGSTEPGDDLWYIDLGSGGGVPGFVWHLLLNERVESMRTWLVEPREKRAWFLSRLPGICGAPYLDVVTGRWGEVGLSGLAAGAAARDWPPVILISLKALHLRDEEVLRGLGEAVTVNPEPPARPSGSSLVVIARYYPAGQQLDEALQSDLGLSAESTAVEMGQLRFIAANRGVLGTPPGAESSASIIYSCYNQ